MGLLFVAFVFMLVWAIGL